MNPRDIFDPPLSPDHLSERKDNGNMRLECTALEIVAQGVHVVAAGDDELELEFDIARPPGLPHCCIY